MPRPAPPVGVCTVHSEPSTEPGRSIGWMEDLLHRRNVLAERACPVCGTDRFRDRRKVAPTCAVCGASVVADEAFVRVHVLGAKAACSIACLKGIPEKGGPEALACPWCHARWPGAEVPARSCLGCAVLLRPEAGYVGLVRGGRIRTFCDVPCLTSHLGRTNPFCG
jgi:hypothetical protein